LPASCIQDLLFLFLLYLLPLSLSLSLSTSSAVKVLGRSESGGRAASGTLVDDAAAVASQPTFTSTPLSPQRFSRDPVVILAVIVSRLAVISPPQVLSLSLSLSVLEAVNVKRVCTFISRGEYVQGEEED